MAQTVTNNGADTDPKSAQYFANMAPENVPAQGQSLKLYSTQLYQSINPFWVVLLTPVIVGFWGFMRSRKREPSTPTKIAIGLVITALSRVGDGGRGNGHEQLGEQGQQLVADSELRRDHRGRVMSKSDGAYRW
jgi:hypothetical protein